VLFQSCSVDCVLIFHFRLLIYYFLLRIINLYLLVVKGYTRLIYKECIKIS
jgi:hypothetical protein